MSTNNHAPTLNDTQATAPASIGHAYSAAPSPPRHCHLPQCRLPRHHQQLRAQQAALRAAEEERPTARDNDPGRRPDRAGALTAILGGSGSGSSSGKASLLNIAARCMHCHLRIAGATTFNGVAGGKAPRRRCGVRVMRQDILLPTLTVREALRYAAVVGGGSGGGSSRKWCWRWGLRRRGR